MMKHNIGMNLRVTGHCNQGGRKYMEDAFVVGYQQSENLKELVYAYFGIFDGHGGREAALFAKEHLMNNIVSQKGFWSDDDSKVLKAIRDGFLATHHAMWKEVGNWPKTVSGLPSTSGTTSSIAFIRKQKLYIGHVGDSKIVLGCQLPESKDWYAQSLTHDHKPEDPHEKKRIDSVGGLVLQKAGVQRVVWYRPHPGHRGPIRRSTPVDQIPFLAVSRSLGDLWSYNYITNEFVVSPEPDVEVFELNPRIHRCILFGSDGLWNMISTHAAVRIVQKTDEENEKIILEGGRANETEKLNNPSRLLVDTALRYWYNLGMRADNISVVTVMLDPPGPCKREVLLKQRVMKRLRPRDEQSILEEEFIKDPPTKEITAIKIRTNNAKRTVECLETPHEKKSSEPPNKERKLSTESAEPCMPKNLPKPVILSPIKVNRSKSKSTENSNSSEAPVFTPNSSNNENVISTPPAELSSSSEEELDPNVKMKESNSSANEMSTSKLTENKNNLAAPLVNSTSLHSEPCKKSGESSKSSLCKNSNEKTNISIRGKNDVISRTEKNDGSYQDSVNSKENGRVHLCEVDNFFKLNRTSDCVKTRNMKPKDLQKKDTIVKNVKMLPKVKTLRSTLSCKSNITSPKKPTAPIRKRRPQTIVPTTCRTRAQSNIHKLKV